MDNRRQEDQERSTLALTLSVDPASVAQPQEDAVMTDANPARPREGTVETAAHRSCSPTNDASHLQTRPRTNTNLAKSALATNSAVPITSCAFEPLYSQSYLPLLESATESSLTCCISEPATPCDPAGRKDDGILDIGCPDHLRSCEEQNTQVFLNPTLVGSTHPVSFSILTTASASTKQIVSCYRLQTPMSSITGGRKRSTSVPTTGPDCRPSSLLSVQQLKSLNDQPRPALSHHQLLTLHQLNLPRPAIFTAHNTPILSRSSVYRRALSRNQQAIAVEGNALSVPKLIPPTSRNTLRELDLREILRNPQLRHDIVFDPNLVFRPNFDGDRGQKKLQTTSRYWTAVAREIELGCRCTTFTRAGNMLNCICSASNTQSGSTHLASRLPSRIPLMITELRTILLSLIPTVSHHDSLELHYDAQSQHQAISDALDTNFIVQQVEHGVLDIEKLANFLGATLKMHCAPMRDDVVDNMVQQFDVGHTAQGLQMAFDILEMMKLDIANHQLRSLRPYLLETALDFELRSCQDYISRRSESAFVKTHAWITSNKSLPTHEAACHGFINLIFDPDGDDYDKLTMRVSQSKRYRQALSPSAQSVPESIQLDLHRMQTMHDYATDITIVYTLLMLYQQFSSPHMVSEEDVESMRRQIWILMQAGGLARSCLATSESTAGEAVATLGWKKMESAPWRTGMREIVLQVVAKATAARSPDRQCHPTDADIRLGQAWIETNLHARSPLFRLLSIRLRSAVVYLVETELAQGRGSETWWTRSAETCGEDGAGHQALADRRTVGSCLRMSRQFQLAVDSTQASSKRIQAKRGREEDDHLDASPRKKTRQSASAELDEHREKDRMLRRSGLSPLCYELESFASKIARVLSFHLAVYEDLYTRMLTA